MLPGTIPVTVITGFLGAGKTTLIRHLLRTEGMDRVALIVNEFGAEPIDHVLLETSSERITLLDNGCICCSMRGDLQETLVKLFARRRAGEVIDYDRVIVETSGLADPAPILHTLMLDADLQRTYRLDAVVTLVDAVNGLEQLDTLVEPTKQAAVADRLVITKCDIASAEAVAALRARLQTLNPYAEIAEASQGEIDPAFLTGIAPRSRRGSDPSRWLGATGEGDTPLQRRALGAHSSGVEAFCLTDDRPFTRDELESCLETLGRLRGPDLLRVKGLIDVVGETGPVVIHAVQHVRHRPVSLEGWGGTERKTRIVFITRNIPRAAVEGLVAGIRALQAH